MGRLLQIVGCVLMLAAAGAIMGRGVRADAEILAPIARAIAQVAPALQGLGGSPSPSPTPGKIVLPNATPTPGRYRAVHGGPLRFSINGSATLGENTSMQTFGTGVVATPTPVGSASPSPFIGAGTATTALAQTNGGIGLFGELTRRTTGTYTDVRIPFSYSVGSHSLIGSSSLLFSTPKYALGYGSQGLSVFGQLPEGSTSHGYYSIVPTHGGDTTLFTGDAYGVEDETIGVEGLRWRESAGDSIYEAGFALANGVLTGKSKTFLIGDALSLGTLTAIGEGAYQTRIGGDQDVSGFNYQARIDDGSNSNYLSAIVRHVMQGYVAIGSGEIYGDDYYGLAYRRSASLQSVSLAASSEHTGEIGGSPLENLLLNLTYTGPLHFGSYAVALQSQEQGASGQLSAVSQSTEQVSTSIDHASLVLGNLLSRTSFETSQTGDESQVGYNAILQVPLRNLVTSFTFNTVRLTSQFAGNTDTTDETVSVGRTFGRTGVGVAEILQHDTSSITNASTSNLQFEVSRAISPVLTVQAQVGFQNLHDAFNPASDGHSRTFAFQINAPFSYGNGIVSGRVDPRLPATIVGRVLTDSSANPTFASLATGGIANAEIILDDKTIQRSDVSGNFQFAFVTPGQHQLRIESASLPRGVTVDVPVDTIQVQGGQTVQVTFLVGTFGGISGHVYGRNDTGAIVPLSNVLLRVDGAAYSQTDSSGAYGFGRLHPGKHTVSVVESSVPAFATFDPASEKKSVNVQNGQYSTVDFDAEPLGSITGTIIFGKDMGVNAGQAVQNAYVVAEPGEHAAIVENDDGTFIIDDLPPGVYTVSVDPETLPDALGVAPDSLTITLQSEEHYQGAAFVVGHSEKKVTFSFVGGGVSGPTAPKTHLNEPRLPLRGFTVVRVDAPKDAGAVSLALFGQDVPFAYDDGAKVWIGAISVPADAKAGPYTVAPKVANGTQPDPATLTVDPRMPIAILQSEPPNAQLGAYVRVRARFLVDAHAGDQIFWSDGQVTTLAKPLSGRVFTFNLRLSLRPLHGLLRARGASLPIVLM